ncbi:TonB-dependent receptor [Hymenobacter psychrotolerans]|uniref:TonB-dependent receptor n=1 Tax=Hymenobacter psychrotolerans TaxID=344998 RepID=UPI00147D45D1|nr:TonB-dependent receptor [Hymenobacter psychrotolerans]
MVRLLATYAPTPLRLLLYGVLGGAGLPVGAWAQQSTPQSIDSVQALPAVRVQATPTASFATGSRMLTLDSAALAPFRTAMLAEALAARTPLYLKNYGPGQLSSITVRGTSAQHTAVLWNGFNIMLPTLGQNDFSLLPVSGNTAVSIQPGPAGGLYGSGAVGGTVLLSSRVRWGAGLQAAAQADAGSFGLRAGSVEGSFSNQKVALRTSLTYRQAQNDFHYDVPGGGRQRQTNAALWQGSIAQDFRWRVGQAGQLQAAMWLTDSDRQIQPSIGTANDHARQRDQSRRLLLGYEHSTARHESAVRVAWFEDILNYSTDQFRNDSRVRTSQIQGSHTLHFSPTTSLRIGAEAQHFGVRMNDYGGRVSEERFAGFALLNYAPWPRLRLSGTLRQALLPGRRSPLKPVLGAEWQAVAAATHTVLLKANAARGYRAPTLNERYYQPGGDPNLLPESSFGQELGVQHTWSPAAKPALSVQTEVTGYHQLVDNWVMWWPKPGQSFVSPRNLRQVRTQGLEASSELSWSTTAYSLKARASYAYTRAYKTRDDADGMPLSRRQLFYLPQHTANTTLEGSWRQWQGTTALSFTSFRYTQEEGPQYLPGFGLLSASVGYTLRLPGSVRATLLAQGYNLTNRSYQNYLYRAMPGRSGQLSLRVAWR